MLEHLDSLYERVIKPISEETPCGENAKYDERFDKVKTEVMKLTAGSEGMDWNAILINSDELLSEKTKDLTLVAYLILGLVKINGYPGLNTGIKCLIYFLDNYWDNMFPPVKRQRARVQTFEWINERIPIILGTVEIKPDHADYIKECEPLVTELNEKAQHAIPSQQISFASLRSEISAAVNKLPAPAPTESKVPEDKNSAADAPREASAPSEDSSGPMGTKDDALASTPPKKTSDNSTDAVPEMGNIPESTDIGSIKEGLTAIVKIVKLIQEVQPEAPVAYRMGRVAMWGAIGKLPPSDNEGKTQIPAPRKDVFQSFEKQFGAANWTSLRKNAEYAFLTSGPMRFNLNIQRYIFLALQGCGASEAAEVVQMETGRLVLQFPEILNLSYNTGLPLADGATRAWCEEAVQLVSSAGSNAGEGDSDDAAWQEEVNAMAQSKGIVAALQMMQTHIDTSHSKRDALRRKLFAAKLCVKHNNYHWAVPMLESIHSQIMHLKLVQWDPDFCSDVWNNLLKGYSTLKNDNKVEKEELDRRAHIRQLLYDVNLVKAVSVTPK